MACENAPNATRLRILELDPDWFVGAGGRGLVGLRCTGVEAVIDGAKLIADIRPFYRTEINILSNQNT
jgi:hypothetical protein